MKASQYKDRRSRLKKEDSENGYNLRVGETSSGEKNHSPLPHSSPSSSATPQEVDQPPVDTVSDKEPTVLCSSPSIYMQMSLLPTYSFYCL